MKKQNDKNKILKHILTKLIFIINQKNKLAKDPKTNKII